MDLREAGNGQGIHRGVAAPGDNNVGLAEEDGADTACQCLCPGGACAGHGEVGPSKPVGNRDLSAGEVRQKRCYEIRGERLRSAGSEVDGALREGAEAADSRANDHGRALLLHRILGGIAGVGKRFLRSRQRKQDERVVALHLARSKSVLHVQLSGSWTDGNHAGDPGGQVVNGEAVYRPDPGLPLHEALPVVRHPDPEGRNDSHPRDDDPVLHAVPSRPARPVKYFDAAAAAARTSSPSG